MTKRWTVAQVIAFMDEWYPPHTAEEWDRVGLVVGDPRQMISRIYIAVDPVSSVISDAIKDKETLVITHHPLYLRGTSYVAETSAQGRIVADLIRSNSSLFTAHTNADVAQNGVADALAALIGLNDTSVLKVTGTNRFGQDIGLGRIGSIDSVPLGEFSAMVASVLPEGPQGLAISGDPNKMISKVAVAGGSGDSLLPEVRRSGVQAYLTGDLRHHPTSDFRENSDVALLCASHWATEWPWVPVLARQIRQESHRDGIRIEVCTSRIVSEPWNNHLLTTGGTQ